MRKIIISTMILLLNLNIYSQNYKPSEKFISFGAKGAIGISSISQEDDLMGWKVAYSIGGLVNFNIAKPFSIQPEILYSFKGGDKSIVSTLFKTETHIYTHISYLEIPVMGKLSFGNSAILFGPYFAFKISDNLEVTGDGATILNPIVSRMSDHINDVDFGISAGFETFVNDNIAIELRGNYGFMNIYDEKEINSTTEQEAFSKTNKNISVLAGIKFYF